MADTQPSVACRYDSQGLPLDLGAWTARLEVRLREFVCRRSLELPPVLLRFLPPRTLPKARA
jgi:hypothetical protein